MKIMVGLGNPAEKYDGTRHNLGFEVVDQFYKRIANGLWQMEKKFNAEVLQVNYPLDDTHYPLLLVKPQTFMNNSGEAVAKIVRFFKVDTKDVIVVHDDLDLFLGKMKVRLGGGAGGHHGVESVIAKLGSDQFVRVRLGIGTDQGFLGEHKRINFNAEHFVMERFLASERSKVKSMLKHGLQAIEVILEKGVEIAQNQFN